MGAKKIKVDKKRVDRAKTEEILGLYDRFKVWAEEHYVAVSVAVVVLLSIPLVIWGFSAYRQAAEQKAGQAYAQAVEQWPGKNAADTPVWEGIIAKLEKCIQEHPGTKAAMDARLDLARAYFHLGRYEEAEKVSDQVLRQAGQGNDLQLLARYQLAQCYEMLGKTEEALAQWGALHKEKELLAGLKREVSWRMATLYARKGQYDRAVPHYEEALKASGAYPSAPLLQEELALAKARTKPPEPNEAGSPAKADNPG